MEYTAMRFRKNVMLKNSVHFWKISKIWKRNISFKYEKPEPRTGKTRALDHFDDFYKSVFKKKWPSVRLGLLSPQKKIAVINNYTNIEETENFLLNRGAFNLKSFLDVQKVNLNKTVEATFKTSANSNQLNRAIYTRLKNAEEKEINELYPNDKDVPVKARFYNENQVEDSSENDEYFYNPEDEFTSLVSDVAKSEMDKSRLILPDSKTFESSLNEFVPATKLRGLTDYISESEYYKYYRDKREMQILIEPEDNINFPDDLRVYIFDRGDISRFPKPVRNDIDIYNYLLMDGADLITTLALDVQPGEAVLDMDNSTGVEALCLLQSLKPSILVCNTNENIKNLFRDYLFDFSPSWKNILKLISFNYNYKENQNFFDKILLNVCCTEDRKCLTDLDDNYFSPLNLRKRIKLPEYQSSLLAKALKLVRPGGAVIYATKTLSPIQNDGVVSEALNIVWNEEKIECCIKDLTSALAHTALFFNYGKHIGLKYGTLVVPFLPSNFGPKYFSKIIRKT